MVFIKVLLKALPNNASQYQTTLLTCSLRHVFYNLFQHRHLFLATHSTKYFQCYFAISRNLAICDCNLE